MDVAATSIGAKEYETHSFGECRAIRRGHGSSQQGGIYESTAGHALCAAAALEAETPCESRKIPARKILAPIGAGKCLKRLGQSQHPIVAARLFKTTGRTDKSIKSVG